MTYPLVQDLADDGIPVTVTCRVLGHHPTSDRRPEPHLILSPRHRWPARRRDLPPIQLDLPLRSFIVPISNTSILEVLRPPVESGQFRSNAFLSALKSHGLVGSMGRVGACGDNAAMESFFSLLQNNVLDRQRWDSREELRVAMVVWIERTNHRRRRQRRLGRITPIEFETLHTPAAKAA